MNDTAAPNNTPNNSYVDDYLPPQVTGTQPFGSAAGMPPAPGAAMPNPDPSTSLGMTNNSMPAPAPVFADGPEETLTPNEAPAASAAKSEDLTDQNIFYLLGVENASDQEKESFLDELQQVIWEDFLENDVDLLLTEEELVEFKKIPADTTASEDDKQNKMVEYLEKLVPDLEKIMLEKALELKEEMMRERITQLTEQFKDQPEKSAAVKEALALVEAHKWASAAAKLNAIPA